MLLSFTVNCQLLTVNGQLFTVFGISLLCFIKSCVSLSLVSQDVLLIRSTNILCTILAQASFVIVNSWSYFLSKVVIRFGSRNPLVKVELEVSLAELLQEVDTSRRCLQEGNVTSVLLVMMMSFV